jgi:hypothetical protein
VVDGAVLGRIGAPPLLARIAKGIRP